MSLYIIATISERVGARWVLRGYKIINTTTGQYKLLSEASIKSYKLSIENATFVDGHIKATNGDFKRYTNLNAFDGEPINEDRMVILGKDSEGYYLCVEHPSRETNLISRKSFYELKHSIKMSNSEIKVANARIDKPDSIKEMIVRPIKGEFKIVSECPKFKEKDFDLSVKQGSRYSNRWKVRVVHNGEKKGRDYCLVHNGEPIVEFYDMSANPEKFPIGQFVSSYYLDTILEHKGSLFLDTSVESWYLEANSIAEIQRWLKGIKY